MKFTLLGIAVILFGIAIIIAYSSSGYGYSSGTTFGLVLSSIGFITTLVSLFLYDK